MPKVALIDLTTVGSENTLEAAKILEEISNSTVGVSRRILLLIFRNANCAACECHPPHANWVVGSYGNY
jgi:hypothetical protein